MVSTVGQRPNHYETLGLTPAADDKDISRAFARKMSAFRWHPAGAAAQVWIAYETLRDRIRRADYDRALGLAPKPPREWTMAVTRDQWTPFVAPVTTKAAPRLPREPEPRTDPPVDPRLESIAATLRELSNPAAVERSPEPAPEPPGQWRPDDGVAPLIDHIMAVDRAEKAALRASQVRGGTEWKWPILSICGLLLGAGLIGAFAGLSASDNQGSAQGEPAATAARPAARHPVASTKSLPIAASSGLTFATEPAAHAAAAHAKPKGAPSRQQLREIPAGASAPLDSQTAQADAAASGQFSGDPLAPQPPAAAANLPLPKNVVARTIERIGYSCGEVSSSAAVEGSPGTFTVTCSSGQSFRATQVHGRYHFRRAR